MDIKNKITNFLETGISSWTGERIVRYPIRGNPVFLELLELYKETLNYDNVTTFFECGTYNGNNAGDFSNVFEKVITAEVSKILWRNAVATHRSKEKIIFLNGDATTELRKYLIGNPNERMVILLDDHVGHHSFIREELETIAKNSNADHIIIIDDVDQLGKGTYPPLEEIVELVNGMNERYVMERSNHKLLIYIPLEHNL